ncbi:cobalamin biosynthesis protein CbiX [Streptomyces tateyamensis]|uniref:Cobalamin biosynthesis protein CbiX n=1 Tax=Streptomyces tateyamensis TaxID=565073 RepID=A0A2V4PAK4_9ACTN|nr:sirohydrochlorin chelatase [Streptomyces tateyamensis]PYC88142.1 cobalamin biosynthesis protein CbiX [Streptomyces tateyamensis]
MSQPTLLLIAHGSRDPRHAATVDALVRQVRAQQPGLAVDTAYLDHSAPRLPRVLERLAGRPAVAVPLLLNRAYHAKHDIPAALLAAGAGVGGDGGAGAGGGGGLPVAEVLGAPREELLLAALERRLAEAGLRVADPVERARTGLVLAAAGSSDPAADAATRALAAHWGARRGWAAVTVAYASAGGPRVPEALAELRAAGAERTAVAPYLLAPGLLPDRIASAAAEAGADLVAPVLGAAPELAKLVLARYAAVPAVAARQRAACVTARRQAA